MNRLLAAALALGLAAPARSENPPADPRPTLEAAAASRPEAPFDQDEILPASFRAWLRKKGYPSQSFTNRRVLELAEQYLKQRRPAPTGATAVAAGPSDALQALQDAEKGVPGSPPPFDIPRPPDPRPQKHGLNFLGLEMGSSQSSIEHRNEPYQHKGIDAALDWNIGARLPIDGIGASASYRHPEHMRSLSLGFVKYWDWPAAIGLGPARDTIYSWFGGPADKPTGGFEADASGALNAYVAGRAIFSTRQDVQGTRTNDIQQLTVGGGYSPLGDNTGKAWNVSALGDFIWQQGKIEVPGQDVDRKGVGFSMGAAFQLALNQFKVPWLPPPPVKNAEGKYDSTAPDFFFDRVQQKLLFAESPLSSFGVTSVTELSFYLFRHLWLAPSINVTCTPYPQPQLIPGETAWGFGFNLGADLRY